MAPFSKATPLSAPLVAAVFAVLGCFLLTQSVQLFAFGLRLSRQALGFGYAEDLLPRFVLYSLLPFGFNAAFGAVAGLRLGGVSARLRANAAAQRPGRRGHATLFGVFLALLAWWALFNLPVGLAGEGGGWFAGRTWPPRSYYPPLARELVLYFHLGNLGLFWGFCMGAAGGVLARPRRPGGDPPQKRKGPLAESLPFKNHSSVHEEGLL